MNKKFILIIILSMFFISTALIMVIRKNSADKVFLSKNELIEEIARCKNIDRKDVDYSKIEIQYTDLDFDDDLDIMISYRTSINDGIFLVYECRNNKFFNVFIKPWAIEKMGYGNVVVSNTYGDKKYEQKAYVINLTDGEVKIRWEGIINSYDYTNLENPQEIHANYYVDDRGILNYFYKVDNLDLNYNIIDTKYYSEQYIWNEDRFEKQK